MQIGYGLLDFPGDVGLDGPALIDDSRDGRDRNAGTLGYLHKRHGSSETTLSIGQGSRSAARSTDTILFGKCGSKTDLQSAEGTVGVEMGGQTCL